VDRCHFVWWCLLYSVDGVGKAPCGLQDAIGSFYDRDRDCMVLIAECARGAFASCVLHDDTNAPVVGGGMGEVPSFGGMIAPRFVLAGFLMNQDLHAEQCHWRGIKQEGPFKCFVCGQ
jgi:hypothetical protein